MKILNFVNSSENIQQHVSCVFCPVWRNVADSSHCKGKRICETIELLTKLMRTSTLCYFQKICYALIQGLPTWVHVSLGVHLLIWMGTFKVSNRRDKYIYSLCISKYLYIYQWILFSKTIICFLLNKTIISHGKITAKKSNYDIERHFRGTCSSVEMLNGYMVRERLGTPALSLSASPQVAVQRPRCAK